MHIEALPPCDSEWFAAQVRVGREQYCARHLQVRGYQLFLPCYREHRQWSDRVKPVVRPLFEGYIFCRASRDVVGKVVTIPGVICIVGDGTRALPIPVEEIEAIQRIVNTGMASEPWPFLQAGQRVQIDAGPLRGMHGIVVKVKNRERLIVSVSLLKRSIAVEIDADWVSGLPESWVPPADKIA
jgi:transcription antitermination factor NusG